MNKVKNSKIHRALRTLGLTNYEARAYVCLVEKGLLNAGDISRLTEIPHSKVYEVLRRLEKRRLVEVQKGRPLIFRALEPTTALNRLERESKESLEKEFHERKTSLESDFEQRMVEVAQAQKRALDELENIFEKSAAVELSEDAVWTIRGADNLNAEAKDIITGAAREVRLMFPNDDFSTMEEAVKIASSRGVRVQLLIHDLTPSVHKILENVEVFREEAVPPTNCGIVLADGKKAIFISENYDVGFKTSSKSVIMVLTHFYEHEVEESAKI